MASEKLGLSIVDDKDETVAEGQGVKFKLKIIELEPADMFHGYKGYYGT